MTKLYLLLATYNGAKYISEQLDSLLSQTFADFHILISDDRSNDDTMSIINQYCKKHKNIILLPQKDKKMGACGNFEYLLENAGEAEYIMFCDQDDVWKPDKIQLTMTSMKEEESLNKNRIPVLVYSDMQYVANDLTPIFLPEIQFKQENKQTLLVQNYIYGCTMLINKPLYQLLLPISKKAENHDSWVSAIACMAGKIKYIPVKTILYRQHDANASGNYTNSSFKKRFKRNVLNLKTEGEYLYKSFGMLKDACEHLKNKSNSQYYFLANDFLKTLNSNKFYILKFMLKNKIFMLTKLQTSKMFFLILIGTFDLSNNE